MTNQQLVPAGLGLMEYASINWVLSLIKREMLNGRPSGQVIDQALAEVMELAAGGQG